MKLSENEKALVRALVDYEAHINEAKTYLKETYNIDAEFESEDMTCKLTSETATPIDMIDAKDYINELFTEGMVSVIY